MFSIRLYLTLLAVVLLSVSCSSGSDIDVSVPSGPDGGGRCYEAGFFISLGDDNGLSRLASRAPGEGYEPGSMPENYINLSDTDFRVYLFDKDDRYVASLDDIALEVVDVSGNMKRYHVKGSVTKESVEDIGGQLKVMMLANWHHSYPQPVAGMSIDQIATSTASVFDFDYVSDQNVGFDRPIPMFGVSNLMSVEFSPEWNTDLGTLHMLRAYAKVRVRAGEGSLPITSVQLTRGNTQGYCAPIGVKGQDDYVHGSYELDYWHIPSIPVTSDIKENIDFTAPTSGSGDTWILYVPEFINLNTDADGNPDPRRPLNHDRRTQIKVNFKDHTIDEYIDFKYYGTPPDYAGENARTGDYFDLLRNTVYDYTLTKRFGEANVEIEVDVQPYAEQELDIDFGLMRDEQGDLMILPEKDVNGKDSLPEYFMDYLKYYKKDTIFEKFPLSSLVPGDYYAIHRGQDGEMSKAEIWLKDIDGAHVLENFSQKDDNDQNCSTRHVELYFGFDKYYYHKDRDGDRRLEHYSNHWSIALDRKDYMIFKSPDNKERYEVASFDKDNPNEFYIVPSPAEDDDNYFFIKINISDDGTISKESVSVPKNPKEETE